MSVVDELGQDLRYAARALRSSPGFSATALLTLAIGIASVTSVFSVVRGVLLEPLPFRAPEELVRVWHARPATGAMQAAVSEPDFLDWQRQARRASSMGAFYFAPGLSGLDLTGSGDPQRLSTALVTDGYFETLGVPALIGRTLIADDQLAGRNRVVVLGHGLWTRRFAADAGIVGRSVSLNGQPFQVIGVMPPGFTYPADRALDAWVPLSFFGPASIGRSRGTRFLQVVARIAPGASDDQLNAELGLIAMRLAATYPDNPGWTAVTTRSLRESIVGDVRRPLLVLMAAVAMLLLITCANVASLLIARASARQREFAVRVAVGAGRGRLVRQLVAESLLLAAIGGALGVALGIAASRGLAVLGASQLPRAGGIRVDGYIIAFALAVALLSGLAFGIAPGLRVSAANLHGVLRAAALGSSGGAGQRIRAGLVVAEVALAVVLVVGAGLAAKSFARLLDVAPGWNPESALVVQLTVPDRFASREARLAHYDRVLDVIRAVPGVRSAGAARDLPLRGAGEGARVTTSGETSSSAEGVSSQVHHISTDYFAAMGTPLLAGRGFERTDVATAPPVVIVNEELGRRLWPGESPTGKSMRVGAGELRVVGVVASVRQRGLAEPVEPTLYVHAQQTFRSRMSIVVRTNGEPTRYAVPVRRAIWSVDANQAITEVTTLDALLGDSVARPRLLAWLLSLFGTVGLTLGALGVFGVLAYAVNQRRQEIGVRIALGASPWSVFRLVVGQGMALTVVGVAVGIGAAALLTRSMQSILFSIAPTDVATFGQVAAGLLLVALVACWIPARRALHIDPVIAFRGD